MRSLGHGVPWLLLNVEYHVGWVYAVGAAGAAPLRGHVGTGRTATGPQGLQLTVWCAAASVFPSSTGLSFGNASLCRAGTGARLCC